MLEDLPFAGTMRVANKGTDAALVVRPAHTPEALRAAKRCGVRGISTAVLEEADAPDQRTVEYFCGLTGRLAFSDQALLDAYVIPPGTKTLVSEACTEDAFSQAVIALKRMGEGSPASS